MRLGLCATLAPETSGPSSASAQCRAPSKPGMARVTILAQGRWRSAGLYGASPSLRVVPSLRVLVIGEGVRAYPTRMPIHMSYMHDYTHVYTHALHACLYAFLYTCPTRMSIRMSIFMCIDMSYTYAYTHVYTHVLHASLYTCPCT